MASLFFSYCHKDEALRDQLESHLALLKIQGLISAWHDRRIIAGDNVDNSISSQLESADIVLLLVSADFINSDYCYSREMTRALERDAAGEARVIPVILRHCDWHSAPFGSLLAAPKDGKPVMSWPDRDEAFTDVARQVRAAVSQVRGQPRAPSITRLLAPTAAALQTAAIPVLPRTSNLRLRKEFTEQERDDFLFDAFDFICKFFDGSVQAVQERNAGVSGRFEKIDSRCMEAILYRQGKTIAQCSIRLESFIGRSKNIAFSDNVSARAGSANELLSLEATDQSLFLKSMGMSLNRSNSDQHLSREGAAELLWGRFIERAQ